MYSKNIWTNGTKVTKSRNKPVIEIFYPLDFYIPSSVILFEDDEPKYLMNNKRQVIWLGEPGNLNNGDVLSCLTNSSWMSQETLLEIRNLCKKFITDNNL